MATKTLTVDLPAEIFDVQTNVPLIHQVVVGQLAAAQEVALAERTLEETVIDGVSAPWYRITAPFEGWVFGGFLE